MKQSRLMTWLAGGVGLVALVAAACAPAGTPPPRGGTTDGQAAPKPLEVQKTEQEAKSAPKPGAETPKAEEKKAATSVSGIPLDPEAKPGGVLHIAYGAEGPTFSDWEEAGAIAPSITHKTYSMMIQNRHWGTQEDFNNLAFFEIHPDLAKSWENSQDGLTWTFHLRDGIKWSDGKPVTCADTKWSYDTIRTGDGLLRSPRALHFNTVKEITCADDLTMVVTQSRPKAGLLEVFGMPYHVIRPKHRYENDTNAMREKPPDVYNGPFSVKQWVPGERYDFVRNPDYWDKPFPYLDGIEMRLLNPTATDAALRTGRIDMITGSGLEGARANNMLRECTDCVFWDRLVWSGFTALMTHHQRPPWNTPEIKDAISYSLDRVRHGQVAHLGWQTEPTAGIFYPGTTWDMPDDRLAKIPGYNFKDPEGNKAKARELLAKAGYQPGELTINFAIWNVATVSASAIVLGEDLKAVGFNVNPILLETARAYAAWTAGDFDVGLHGFWVAGLDPDVVLYEHFYTGSDRNYNRYSNPEVDRLIDEQSATTDPELRKQRVWDVAELILREHGKHIIGNGSARSATRPNVRGWMPALNYLAGYGPWHRMDHIWLEDATK